MVRRTARIESATFWSGVKSATRCFSYNEIWKRSCPWLMLEMNNVPRHFLSAPPPPPSGLNGRPQSTLYIGALILERSFAEFGILHHPPCIWGDIFIPPFTVNDNAHWWMKKIWPKFRQKKKSAIEICRPPPLPLNKMVVDNITTTAARHCLNDIWIHFSQKYFKKFPSQFQCSVRTEIVLIPPTLPQSSGLYWSVTDFHRS